MRSVKYLVLAALVCGVSGTAMAQTPTPAVAPATDVGPTRSHWIAAGFVGSNLGSTQSNFDVDSRRSFDFGGEIGYLWKGMLGAEFLANFTPSFGVSSALITDNPQVNSYMANGVFAL